MTTNLIAVIFDLDDTLVDKSATLLRVAALQYSHFSLGTFEIDQQDWNEQYVRLNNLRIEKSDVFERLGKRFALSRELQALLFSDFDTILGHNVTPNVGAVETVRKCKSHGLKVGIVTNGRDEFQRSKIRGLGISDSLDVIVTSGGIGIKKPDLRIFSLCLHSLKVEPQEAAFVGDDFVADMEPAIKLGMSSIWKSDSKSSEVSFSSNDFYEIQKYLLQPNE